MDTWVTSIIVSTCLHGVMHFLYKISTEKGLNADLLINVVGATVTALALASLVVTGDVLHEAFTTDLVRYAFFNGLSFGLATLTMYAALRRSPAAIVFPVTQLRTALVMLAGVILLKDAPTELQYLGMVLALGVVVLVASEEWDRNEAFRTRMSGLLLAILAALLFALSMIISKLAAASPENRLAYIALSYAIIFLFTLLRYVTKGGRRPYLQALREGRVVLFGAVVGILNYIGYLLVLQALGTGPLSLVQGIFSTSIIIPVVLARLVYKESLTRYRIAAVMLAIASVVLISYER